MLRKTLVAAVASLVLAAACLEPARPPVVQPPPPPNRYDITLHVFFDNPALDRKAVDWPVSLHGPNDAPVETQRTDGAGNYTFTNLLGGTYGACAHGTRVYTTVCQEITVPGANEVDLTLRRPIAPPEKLRVEGRFWMFGTSTFRPVFASFLYSLARPEAEWGPALDQLQSLGFNGIRVFAGHLGQVGQTPESARAKLPALLDAAEERGMYVYVCAITGGRDPVYDVEGHLKAITALLEGRRNVLLEVANEIGHPTLSETASDIPKMTGIAQRVIPQTLAWTMGAPLGTDEPTPEGAWPTNGGQFNDAHLDRGRDRWNQVRRLREIYAISEATKKPAMSGEPIGSDEQTGGSTGTKQRLHDPSFFFTMGVLCRGFELGCVFHSEDGLQGRPLGPNQTEDAQAFIAGTKAIQTEDRLNFQNAGWATSPVEGGNFDNGIVRIYSFMNGSHGYTVLLGITGDPRLKLREGWHVVGVVAERSGVQVLEISR